MERHRYILPIVLIGAIVISDLLIFGHGHKKTPVPQEQKSDTVVVVKTDTLVETRYINTEKTRTVIDTIFLETVEHDTVEVPIPIEYRYNRYENALVLYHGYMAGIDSVVVYPKHETRYITNNVVEVRQPAFVFGPSITAGVDMNGNIRLIPGVSGTFNIRTLKKKR